MYNVISRDREELFGIFYDLNKYERYDLDSGRVFHDVIIDDVLIGYYLKDSIPNPEIENSFIKFFKKEFKYKVSGQFPCHILE